MEKKILVRGYYGFRNTGDDALIYSILQSLMHIPNSNFNVLTRAEVHKPKALKNIKFIYPSNKNLWVQLLKADTLIFGGGSQLQDYGKLRMVIGMLKRYLIVKVMKLRRKKVIFLGVSIGPIETKIGKIISKLTLNNSDFIAVRDNSSMDQLNKMSINREKIMLTPDLAITLKQNIEVPIRNEKELVIGVNLLPFYSIIKNQIDIENNLIINLANGLNNLNLKENNLKIKLFSFQDNTTINDFEILEKLSQRLEVEHTLYKYQENPLDTLEEIATCNRFIGMRLHSSIFSYIGEVPQIVLSYHPKCEGFAKSVGYSHEAILKLTELESNELFQKIQDLVKNPNDYTPTVSVDHSFEEVENLFKYLESDYI